MMKRDPILEAVGPAGVGGDVAADAGDGTRGGIRRVTQAQGSQLGVQVAVDDARLHHHLTALRVDAQDAVHRPQVEQDLLGGGQEAGGKIGAGGAGNDRHAMVRGVAQRGHDVGRVMRPYHDVRQATLPPKILPGDQ